jgi:hypothetical protein
MTTVAPPETTRAPARASADLALRVVVLVIVMSPVAAVLVLRIARPYFPLGDVASIDLRVRDVFTSHTPLVGAYSRGFDHPGPMLFDALAPLSRLAGGATWATLVGAALVQGVGVLLLAWAAFRRAGTAFMVLMLGALGLTYLGLDGLGQFTKAWNPYAAIPFFLLFLVLTWAFALGRRWCLVGALAAGTFVVQSHVGYSLLVAVALVWAVAVLLVERRLVDDAPPWTKVLASSAVVLVVLWLPPVIQEVRDRPGNLTALWHYFRDNGTTLGLHQGAGLLGTEFRILPPWLGGNETYGLGSGNAAPSSAWWLLIPIALLGLGWLAARRSGRRDDRRLVELAALMGAVGVVAISRITVDPLPYVFYWRVLLATFVVAAGGWAIGHALPSEWAPWPRRIGVSATLVAVVWGFGAQTVDVIDTRHHLEPAEPLIADVDAQVRAQGLPTKPVLVRAVGSTLYGFDQGLIDALDRDGAPVRVDRKYGYHFGDQRTADPAAVDEIWYVAEEGRYAALLPQLPAARLVASASPLPRADERELRRLQRDAADALHASGHDDLVAQLDNPFLDVVMEQRLPDLAPGLTEEMVRRITQLNQEVSASGSCRCTIVAFPADRDPSLPFTIG